MRRWRNYLVGVRRGGRPSPGYHGSDAVPHHVEQRESTSVGEADLSQSKQMEFCLHIVQAHSDLLGTKCPPHIFRTMTTKLCGKQSYRPRVESSLALLEPFKVKKQWVTLKRAKRLVEKRGRAWAEEIVENTVPHDTAVFKDIGRELA
jgi:hypothetical protein